MASYQTDVIGERIEKEVIDYYDMLVLIKNPKFNSIKGSGLLDYASQTFEQSIRQSEYKMLGTALSVGTTTGTVGVVGVTPTTVIGATTGVASTGTIRRGR